MPDLESLRRELENLDYSDLESVKRKLQSYESLESKMHFLSIVGMAIKHEFAAAEKEWVAAGQSFESPLRAKVDRWGMAQGKYRRGSYKFMTSTAAGSDSEPMRNCGPVLASI
jgi:hypothetical protein